MLSSGLPFHKPFESGGRSYGGSGSSPTSPILPSVSTSRMARVAASAVMPAPMIRYRYRGISPPVPSTTSCADQCRRDPRPQHAAVLTGQPLTAAQRRLPLQTIVDILSLVLSIGAIGGPVHATAPGKAAPGRESAPLDPAGLSPGVMPDTVDTAKAACQATNEDSPVRGGNHSEMRPASVLAREITTVAWPRYRSPA